MTSKRAFVVGLCTRKSRAMWLLRRPKSPIKGPFTLCAMVTSR